MGIIALIYEAANFGGNGTGAMLLMATAMYPTQMLYNVCGSQLVQSSPYKRAIMTSLTTIVTLCCGILHYLVVMGIEGIRILINPEAAGNSAYIILLTGMFLLLIEVYLAIAYRYFQVSMFVMIGSITGFYYLFGITGDGAIALQCLSGISIPAAIAAGLGFAVLGSLLQYGISLLVYKIPISRSAIYGLLRQQT